MRAHTRILTPRSNRWPPPLFPRNPPHGSPASPAKFPKAKFAKAKCAEATLAKARLEAKAALEQKREGAVNLRYVAERLRDIKNMDEVEAFYKECYSQFKEGSQSGQTAVRLLYKYISTRERSVLERKNDIFF